MVTAMGEISASGWNNSEIVEHCLRAVSCVMCPDMTAEICRCSTTEVLSWHWCHNVEKTWLYRMLIYKSFVNCDFHQNSGHADIKSVSMPLT